MSRNKFNLKDKKTKIIIGSTIIIVLLLFIGIGLGLYSINNTDSKNIATQGQDKTDKKEENKKEDSNKEESKADSDKKEENTPAGTETSSKEESKSESSNTGSSSNGGSNSSNNEVANKPSNSGGSSSSNSGSPSNGGGSTSTPNPPASSHSHSWNPVTDTVWHDEVGHYETVVIKDAWTEEIPIYEEKELMICFGCNQDISHLSQDEYASHAKNHMLNGENSGWKSDWQQVQVGTDKINHPAVTEDRWVVDKAAWSETVTTGYKCSCGATK